MNTTNIAIIQGANLPLVGFKYHPTHSIESYDDINAAITDYANKLPVNIRIYQSNTEGNILDFLYENRDWISHIIINPGSFAYHGYGILDAIFALRVPYIEVALKNVQPLSGNSIAESIFSKHAIGVIAGFGSNSYLLALDAAIKFQQEMKV